MPCQSHSSDGLPQISFKNVGRNNASTFTGLCSKHDNEIFRPIENEGIDFKNSHHLFLISYRSILREFHAVIQAACRMQVGYKSRVNVGLSPGDRPDAAGLTAVAWLCNAYDCYLYKKKFDEAFMANNFLRVEHDHIEYTNSPPTIAVSALFSLDDIEWPDDVAKVALNVFPFDGSMHILFSYLKEERLYAQQYLKDILNSSGDYQRYLISKLILQHCENFTIAPAYWENLSEQRRESIVNFFFATLEKNLPSYEDNNLFLF